MKQFEIEFRALITEEKHDELKKFLSDNAEDLGEDDKTVFFFVLPEKLIKVVDNKSKGTAQIVYKGSRIGHGSSFEEIEVEISSKEARKAVSIFKALDLHETLIESFQKRQNYKFKGVELALKHSDEWGHHLELEILINDESQKEEVEEKIFKIAEELGVKIMSDEELREFTEKIEKEHNS